MRPHARRSSYLKWHHITLVQVQEEVKVGHCDGEVLGGLLVVVDCQLVEVLGGERQLLGRVGTVLGTCHTNRFLVTELSVFNWEWVSILPTRQAGTWL